MADTLDNGKTAKAIEAFKNSGKTAPPRTAEEIRAEIAALQAELTRQEEAERKLAMVDSARRGIALLAAMREAYRLIQEMFPDTFADEKYAALATAQAWPRDVKMRRAADLSETQAGEARERGRKAIEGL
jgi:hypothetical protein